MSPAAVERRILELSGLYELCVSLQTARIIGRAHDREDTEFQDKPPLQVGMNADLPSPGK